jgi:hypothetical protein
MNNDKKTIRELAKQTAEIASLPVQEEKRRLWRGLNGLRPERPMVMIDQVCWNEMHIGDELKLTCEDETLREWEFTLRKQLYQWKHFPVDSVVEGFFTVQKAVWCTGHGIPLSVERRKEDETGDVYAQAYGNRISDINDVEKIQKPKLIYDEKETRRRQTLAEEMFDGIMPVRMDGVDMNLDVWDQISVLMGVEGALYGLADKPDMMYALATRLTAMIMEQLDLLESRDLLCGPQSLVHCTGAWNDELPKEKNVTPWTTKQIWTFGLAQMFSTVSPKMFGEYEVDICKPLYERFGLIYYGCCDPLDLKMKQVRRIPNVRKVSMSTWTDKARGAAEIGRDYVFSHKPNPAYLVHFDEGLIRKDLEETVRICRENGCPLELILKDVSTVLYKPQNLWRWAEIAMEAVQT